MMLKNEWSISNNANEDDKYPGIRLFKENDTEPFYFDSRAHWETIFLGYITFFISLLVIVSNGVLLLVFVRRCSITSTTLILGALAVSDTIICSTRIPDSFYFFTLGKIEFYVPYQWCIANRVLYIVYQIARTASNWLTTFLGLQRCLCVRKPLHVKRICTVKNTTIAIFSISVSSFILKIYPHEGLGG